MKKAGCVMTSFLGVVVLSVWSSSLVAEEKTTETQVTVKFIDAKALTFKPGKTPGISVKVVFEPKSGPPPNFVHFRVFTSMSGWVFVSPTGSPNPTDCHMMNDDPECRAECSRPPSDGLVVTLFFARFDWLLHDDWKQYSQPNPMDASRILQDDISKRLFIRVRHTKIWPERQIREKEFSDALHQYGWDHDMTFLSSMSNGMNYVDFVPEKPLLVEYWADLSPEEIKRGQAVVAQLAKQYKIHVATKKGNRLWHGGFVNETPEIEPPKRR